MANAMSSPPGRTFPIMRFPLGNSDLGEPMSAAPGVPVLSAYKCSSILGLAIESIFLIFCLGQCSLPSLTLVLLLNQFRNFKFTWNFGLTEATP